MTLKKFYYSTVHSIMSGASVRIPTGDKDLREEEERRRRQKKPGCNWCSACGNAIQGKIIGGLESAFEAYGKAVAR